MVIHTHNNFLYTSNHNKPSKRTILTRYTETLLMTRILAIRTSSVDKVVVLKHALNLKDFKTLRSLCIYEK